MLTIASPWLKFLKQQDDPLSWCFFFCLRQHPILFHHPFLKMKNVICKTHSRKNFDGANGWDVNMGGRERERNKKLSVVGPWKSFWLLILTNKKVACFFMIVAYLQKYLHPLTFLILFNSHSSRTTSVKVTVTTIGFWSTSFDQVNNICTHSLSHWSLTLSRICRSCRKNYTTSYTAPHRKKSQLQKNTSTNVTEEMKQLVLMLQILAERTSRNRGFYSAFFSIQKNLSLPAIY